MAHKYKQGNWLRLFINCVFIINGDDAVGWKYVYERFGKATILNKMEIQLQMTTNPVYLLYYLCDIIVAE